ncbi:MAG: FHA domain-containing protein [Anaerolineae bacterium]
MDEISAIFRVSGPNLETSHKTVTQAGIYAGRAAGNDLVLQDAQISRRHMRVLWQDGAFWVEDLNSSNGVWLNNARIEPGVLRTISPGDILRAGPYTLTYETLNAPNMGKPPSTPTPSGNGQSTPAREPTYEYQQEPLQPPVYPAQPVGVREILQPRQRASEVAVSPMERLLPKVKFRENRYPLGIPRDQSTWLQYLPAIYSDPDIDPTLLTGRYLLIFESVISPIIWMVDNFDLYLSPETAPSEWLRWMAGWFDLLLVPELEIERQREIVRQIGWLFLRRGTRSGLERLLELYFEVKPEIIEEPFHFTVRLPLSQSNSNISREVAERLIESQKPAFATYALEIV